MSQSEHAQDRVLHTLVEKKLLDEEAIARAGRLRSTEKSSRSALFYLVKMGEVTSRDATRVLASHFRVQGVVLDEQEVEDEVLRDLPEEVILGSRVVPVLKQGGKLYIAMANPGDILLVDQLKFHVRTPIVPVVSDEYSLEAFINRRFAKTADVTEILGEIGPEETYEEVKAADVENLALQEQVDSSPVVKLIKHYLTEGVRQGASDLHFEVQEDEVSVRYRIDGTLVVAGTPPRKAASQMIRRLKVLSKLDPTVMREPQDGQATLSLGDRVVSFRVSTLPTQYGESVVLRVLDKGSVNLDLRSLGITGHAADLVLDATQHRFGMILATGPTGHGKTTTLYTILSMMNQPDVNIITVEDPIEYSLPGIRQVPVTEKVTFARALRSILRQDPDIIMLGEIRDEETAEVAVKAGMTGHMVISTLHTTDTAGAITRLAQMGVDRFNIGQTLSLVIAQRLVRKVCRHCQEEYVPDPRLLRLARLTDQDARDIRFVRGRGCSRCARGYAGRIGIYEMLVVTPGIQELIVRDATTAEIRAQAIRDGMDTLTVAGLQRVREGLTTLDEVIKNAG